jgi:transcriptional regulator with XRE-family HTH domain
MDGCDIRKVFSHNLKLYRGRAGLSQLSLASSLGLAPNFISDIECGKKWVSPETLAKLAHALHIEPYQFFLQEQELSNDMASIVQAYTTDLNRAIVESIDRVRGRYLSK